MLPIDPFRIEQVARRAVTVRNVLIVAVAIAIAVAALGVLPAFL